MEGNSREGRFTINDFLLCVFVYFLKSEWCTDDVDFIVQFIDLHQEKIGYKK